jgi:hypothetical protein
MSGKRLIVLACVASALVAFYAGTRVQRYRPQMQAYIADLVAGPKDESRSPAQTPEPKPVEATPAPDPKPAAAPVEVAALGPHALPAASSSDKTIKPHSVRALETSLLPLLVDTVAIPETVGVHPGGGGGIAVIGDTILAMDRRGAFFKIEAKGDRIEKLELPPLPDNAASYDQFARKPALVRGFHVNEGFRAHDIEAKREAQGIRLLVSHERYLPEDNTTALAVSTILLGEPGLQPLGPWENVYQGQPLVTEWYSGIASGARMVVRGDDLYLTVGDYNQDNVFMSTPLEAQNPQSDFGKILKIDLRTKAKTLISMGHRNPQGLLITSNGAIYATEHGPRGGDALNAIVAGKNYGWPLATLGTHYTTYDWPNRQLQAASQKFEMPLFAWLPSIGVSNLIEVANFNPAWDNDLLVESLKAESLFRLRRDGNGRIVYVEPIPLGERLRDIGVLTDGTLVLWTDSARLMFVSIDTGRLASNRRPDFP